MNDPLMPDPRLDPRWPEHRRDFYADRYADRTNSSWGWMAGIAVIVVVLAVVYGFSRNVTDDRTGAIDNPPVVTRPAPPVTPPANSPAPIVPPVSR